jgi:hypothetical protein
VAPHFAGDDAHLLGSVCKLGSVLLTDKKLLMENFDRAVTNPKKMIYSAGFMSIAIRRRIIVRNLLSFIRPVLQERKVSLSALRVIGSLRQASWLAICRCRRIIPSARHWIFRFLMWNFSLACRWERLPLG